jgi:hypothetical protein
LQLVIRAERFLRDLGWPCCGIEMGISNGKTTPQACNEAATMTYYPGA